jgi:hypothetical protein
MIHRIQLLPGQTLRGEVLRARPSGKFVAALGDQLEREVGAEAVDPREVLAEQREERCAALSRLRAAAIGLWLRRVS